MSWLLILLLGLAECVERLNPPPAPKGPELGRVGLKLQSRRTRRRCQDLSHSSLQNMAKSSLAEFFDPPIIPPGPPRIPPGRPHEARNGAQWLFFFDENFDHFLVSVLARFWPVLGSLLGVIFGTLGAQVESSSVQNASWKPISIPNVMFHQTHARVYRSA